MKLRLVRILRPVFAVTVVLIFSCNAFSSLAQQEKNNEASKISSSEELLEADKLHAQVVEFFYSKNFKEALPLAKRAVELREKSLGLSNEKTLASLKNLAAVCTELKKTGDAVETREKVLKAEEILHGISSVKLCDNLSKLGWASFHDRDFGAAEKAFKRNLQIRETVFGSESKELLSALNDLAMSTQQKGRFEQSIGYFKRMIAITEKETGNNTDLAELLVKCSIVMRNANKNAEADEYDARAKTIYTSQANHADSGSAAIVPSKILQGYAIYKVAPPYPIEAKNARAQGAVEVLVEINEAGIVTTATAISGRNELRKAAEEAAKQWRFKPSVVAGKTIRVRGILTFNFTLQ